MYSLAVDIGNTTTKIALFFDLEMVVAKRCPHPETVPCILNLKKKYPHLKDAVVCNVLDKQNESYKFVREHFRTLTVDPHIKLPFENLYKG